MKKNGVLHGPPVVLASLCMSKAAIVASVSFGLIFTFSFTGIALAASPITDNFDTVQAWNTFGGSFPEVFQYVQGTATGCHAGSCVQSGFSDSSYNINRMYLTGTPLAEGNITFFSKTDSTLNLNDKVAAASLCNGAPNASNSNCEHWLNFDTNDDEWHQYYFA